MTRKLCQACKAHGHYRSADHVDAIYHPHREPTYVRLCYSHSIELFKFGQKTFIGRYKTEDHPMEYPRNEQVNPLQNYFVFNSFK